MALSFYYNTKGQTTCGLRAVLLNCENPCHKMLKIYIGSKPVGWSHWRRFNIGLIPRAHFWPRESLSIRLLEAERLMKKYHCLLPTCVIFPDCLLLASVTVGHSMLAKADLLVRRLWHFKMPLATTQVNHRWILHNWLPKNPRFACSCKSNEFRDQETEMDKVSQGVSAQ